MQNSNGNLTVTSNKALTLGSDPTSSFASTASLIKFEVDGSEKMRLDASGNVGIGRTPTAYGSFKVLDVAGSAGAIQKIIHTGSTVELQSYASSTVGVVGTATSHPLLLTTGDVERMRITSDGKVGIGTDSPSTDFEIKRTSADAQLRITSGASNDAYLSFENAGTVNHYFKQDNTGVFELYYLGSGSGAMRLQFATNGQLSLFSQQSGSGNSTLKYNTGTGAVTYDTSSRLVKEEIESIPYGLSTVMSLTPKRYKRKDSNDKIEVGFIADEMVEVIPELVGMMKKSVFTDVEEDTEEVAGSVEYEKLTAVLTKAIQEQQDIIDDLKARIEVLEG